jgi:hypothetical protein
MRATSFPDNMTGPLFLRRNDVIWREDLNGSDPESR